MTVEDLPESSSIPYNAFYISSLLKSYVQDTSGKLILAEGLHITDASCIGNLKKLFHEKETFIAYDKENCFLAWIETKDPFIVKIFSEDVSEYEEANGTLTPIDKEIEAGDWYFFPMVLRDTDQENILKSLSASYNQLPVTLKKVSEKASN